VTDRMLSGAGRFVIPAEWKLTDEIVRPGRFMCISTNPCPSLSRRWEAGKELTDADVAALTSGLGFTMTTDHPCERDARVIGVGVICIFTGHGRRVQILARCHEPRSGGTPARRAERQATVCAGLATPDPLSPSLVLGSPP
jgi:hypothetical protein